MHQKEMRVSARQGDIALVELGNPDGTPVIALHGWLDNAASFYPLSAQLKNIRLLAMDLAGHGKSYHRQFPHNYNIWDDLLDILDVADFLALDRFNLLAHSRGAAIATLLSASTDRVDKLGLIDGFLGAAPSENSTPPKTLREYIGKRHKGKTGNARYYSSVDEMNKRRLGGGGSISAEAAKLITERNTKRTDEGLTWSTDVAVSWRSSVHLTSEQTNAFVRSVACPIRLWLCESSAQKHRHRLDMIAGVEQATSEVWAGDHHFHMETNVKAFAGAVESFFLG